MDRFELRRPGAGSEPYGDIIESCYHLDTVAKYGICHTFDRGAPYNWGFCSRSCEFEYDNIHNHPQGRYEETAMEIFDDLPEGVLVTGNSNFRSACD